MALDPAGHPIAWGYVAHHSLRSDDLMVAGSRLHEAREAVGRVDRELMDRRTGLNRAAVLIREAQLIVDIERGALEVT